MNSLDITFIRAVESDQCPICLDPITTDQRGARHEGEDGKKHDIIHDYCLLNGTKDNPHCPLCRANLNINSFFSSKNSSLKESLKLLCNSAEVEIKGILKAAVETGATLLVTGTIVQFLNESTSLRANDIVLITLSSTVIATLYQTLGK